MNKWLFPISLLIASNLIAFAAIRYPRPLPLRIAVVNLDALMRRDPVSRSLKRIHGHDLALQNELKIAVRDNKKRVISPDSFLRDEQSALSSNLSFSRSAFGNILYKSLDDQLRVAVDSSRYTFNMNMESEYKNLTDELDVALGGLEKTPPDTSINKEKFHLFNLRLKHDSLTKDRITAAYLDPGELKAEIEKLSKQINDREARQTLELIRKRREVHDKLHEQFRLSSESRNKEFTNMMGGKIADARNSAKFIMNNYENQLEKNFRESTDARRALLGILSRPHAAASGAQPIAAAAAALEKYRKLLKESLLRKITAVAADGNFQIVLDVPVYYSRPVENITNQF